MSTVQDKVLPVMTIYFNAILNLSLAVSVTEMELIKVLIIDVLTCKNRVVGEIALLVVLKNWKVHNFEFYI